MMGRKGTTPLFLALTLGIVSFGLAYVPAVVHRVGRLCPDFVCYWSAAELIAAGRSPYDPVGQGIVQKKYGWEKEKQGAGVLNLLPYYYPPWFAASFVPLLPLGIERAKALWLIVNIQLLLVTGFLLGGITHTPRSTSVLVASTFAFSLFVLPLGQTSILIFFLVVLAWRLIEDGRDQAAGIILAWMLIKPQVTLILTALILARALRFGRWRVIRGFVAALTALTLGTAILSPRSLLQFVTATSDTPPPTAYFPWLGTSWLALLRSCRLPSGWLWSLYAAVALPVIALAIKEAATGRRWDRLFACGLLAPFFVFPYCRSYDFPVLLPVILLLSRSLSEVIILPFAIIPYFHISSLNRAILPWLPSEPSQEVTFLWVPISLACLWVAAKRGIRENREGRDFYARSDASS